MLSLVEATRLRTTFLQVIEAETRRLETLRSALYTKVDLQSPIETEVRILKSESNQLHLRKSTHCFLSALQFRDSCRKALRLRPNLLNTCTELGRQGLRPDHHF